MASGHPIRRRLLGRSPACPLASSADTETSCLSAGGRGKLSVWRILWKTRSLFFFPLASLMTFGTRFVSCLLFRFLHFTAQARWLALFLSFLLSFFQCVLHALWFIYFVYFFFLWNVRAGHQCSSSSPSESHRIRSSEMKQEIQHSAKGTLSLSPSFLFPPRPQSASSAGLPALTKAVQR